LQERSDNLDGRLRDFKVNDEGKMANVAILEPAHTDALPTGPKKLRILLVSLTAGIILGLIAAVVQDQLDMRLESVGQVSQVLGLTVVGYLPTLPMGIASAGRTLSDSFKPTSALGVACQRVLEVLDTAKRPVPIKSLAITSPTRHDGRSTVACGLAVTFAQQGHRVLLVDTTEDSSLQAALLAATASLPALSNGAALNEPASAFHAQKTTVSNLKLLSCGAVTKDAQQDPGSAVATVLEKAKGEFDLIIVDTPASSRSPMSRIAAAHCDSTLMVVRLSHTDYYAASRLRSDLYNVGADVLGVVLNQSQWELRPPTTSVVTTSSPGVTVSTLDPRAGNNAAPSSTLPGERQAKVLLPIHS
jgi:Mrp family chromosome partitioning ATPase